MSLSRSFIFRECVHEDILEESMVTKQDVAERAGVSTATVGRVLSGKGYVSADARAKVEEAVRALNYRRNNLAANLRKRKSNVIAVLVEDLLNPYYMHLAEAMVERAKEKNCIVSLFAVKDRDVRQVLDDLLSNRVCGVVNLAMFTCDFSWYDIFLEEGIRLINCTATGPKVIVDYTQGMQEAMACLKKAGRTHPAFLAGIESWLAPNDLRVRFFRENAEQYGLVYNSELLLCGNYPIVKAHHVGYELCKQLIESKKQFDSLFCMTDMMALGALKALFDFGYKIPQDVSVIGCDDLDFTGFFQPSLTTIAVDKKAEAYAYVDLILDEEVSDRDVRKVNTRLVERSSV